MRGISTVVDATVFLLLVGGAVGTLAAGMSIHAESAQSAMAGTPAAEDARLVATTTATVNYSVAPTADSADGDVTGDRTDGSGARRTAQGTLASLLADAAVGDAAYDGVPLFRVGEAFERNLSSVVRDRLGHPDHRTAIVARWEPYAGAPLRGRTIVGEAPPRDVDVNAATVAVDSGVPASADSAERAARTNGYEGVARVVAGAVVTGLFPPQETRLALRGAYPVDLLTARRYRQTATALDAGPLRIGERTVAEANERLRVALTRKLAADMTDRFDSPAAAARAVETDTVEITVRTWSP